MLRWRILTIAACGLVTLAVMTLTGNEKHAVTGSLCAVIVSAGVLARRGSA